MRNLLVFGTLLLIGCGKPAPTPAPTAPAPVPAPVTEPAPAPATATTQPPASTPPPAATPKTRKVDKAKLAQATEAQKKFKALLNEGRAAVKADQPELGVTKLLNALEYFDADPSALGELGWAAYRAGPAFSERAYDATRTAIALSKKDSQRGALWYNLGRIAEDDGDLSLALDAYRQSLSYRKNDTVRERLAGLVAKVGGKTVDEGVAALEDVCGELRETEGCEVVVDDAGTKMSPCSCTSDVLGPEAGFGRAALVRIKGTTEDAGGSLDSTYLAVEVAARWTIVGQVATDRSPGLGYVHNTSERVRFAFDTWGTDGTKVLWVEHTNTLSDMDPGEYLDTTTSEHTVVLCAVSGALTCVELKVSAVADSGPIELFGDYPIPEGEAPPKEHREWSLAATLQGGVLTIEGDRAQVPEAQAALIGSFTWAQLVSSAGVRKVE